jgi:hypothetical protein
VLVEDVRHNGCQIHLGIINKWVVNKHFGNRGFDLRILFMSMGRDDVSELRPPNGPIVHSPDGI